MNLLLFYGAHHGIIPYICRYTIYIKRIRNKTRLQKKSRRTPYTQQSRAEQSRAEQSKEQGKEQSRAEQSRAEQSSQRQSSEDVDILSTCVDRVDTVQYIKVTVSFSNKKTNINKIRSLFSKTFQRSRDDHKEATYMMQSINRFYMIIRDFTITIQIDGQQYNVIERDLCALFRSVKNLGNEKQMKSRSFLP